MSVTIYTISQIRRTKFYAIFRKYILKMSMGTQYYKLNIDILQNSFKTFVVTAEPQEKLNIVQKKV